MSKTKIEWTDETWNPLIGCSRISEGCRNCYAERFTHRFAGPGQRWEGLTRSTPDGPRWTGEVRLVEDRLTDPLRWRRPRRVCVNSMSDLFHERVLDKWIDRIFAVMALSPRHTFQILTKCPERMREWFAARDRSHDGDLPSEISYRMADFGEKHFAAPRPSWPLPNVWLGTSVENQPTADARIPLLLQTPAAVRFVSYEPALGPVAWRPSWMIAHDWDGRGGSVRAVPRLDQIIVGGESGPGARPLEAAWVRSTIAACREAGVAVFVKQLGQKPKWANRERQVPMYDYAGEAMEDGGDFRPLRDRKGADPAEWPEDLRAREFPAVRHE